VNGYRLLYSERFILIVFAIRERISTVWQSFTRQS